jgi:flagellar hook-associated protein 2
MAKRGLLNNNSAVNNVMLNLRNAMLTTVTSSTGGQFGLFSIVGNSGTRAIQTSTNFRDNGKLVFDEQALAEALERNPEDIIKLFTDENNGLMVRLERELDRAIKTTGASNERGTLIQRAGLATGQSANDNAILSRIKSLNSTIDVLQRRYDRQQERLWRMFTNMEKQFAVLNSQSDHILGMFPSQWTQ